MESGKPLPALFAVSFFFALAIFAGCAESGPVADQWTVEREQQDVDQFFDIIESCREIILNSPYFETLAQTILASTSLGLAPPYSETAMIDVTLDSVGYVENLELKSVTSPTIEAPFLLVIEAPPSFPPAPRDVQACIGRGPFPIVLQVIETYQCLAQSEYLEYRHDVERRLYKVLYSPRFSSSPGHGWVIAFLTLGSEGRVRELKIRGKDDSQKAAKVRIAVRGMGTLPPPPEFSRCFAEKPLRLRVEVQGE